MASVFPAWLRVAWLCLAPFGLSLAARIAWEKTIWTWSKGPQMVGFSLMHLHPVFSLLGGVSCLGLMLWLVPAGVYLIRERKRISLVDVQFSLLSAFAALAMVTPDQFFA